MTLKKLMAILEFLGTCGFSGRGSHLYGNSNGELVLSLDSQPSFTVHEHLLKKGFVLAGEVYVYRPR